MTREELKIAANNFVVDILRSHFCNDEQEKLPEEDIIELFVDEYGLAMDSFIAGYDLNN